MAVRRIPRNPNVPTPPAPRGLEMHTGRTIVLLALLTLIGYLLYARTAPIRLFAPELRRDYLPPAPRALPSSPQVPATPHPIVGEARAQPPKDQLAAALRSFNDAFRAARLSAEPSVLSRVATGDWLAQEQRLLSDLRAQGQTEQWTLLELDIGPVAFDGAGATVCAAERWSRVQLQGGVSGSAEERSYVERYTLQRQGERWLVTQITYLDGPCP